MKTFYLLIALSLIQPTHATVDIQGQATIVVKNDSEEYFVQTVPTSFCIGIESFSLAEAITKPVVIKSKYGCGNPAFMERSVQVNEATCAKLSATEVPNSDGSFNPYTVSIKKDLSQCGDKAKNPDFLDALDRAIDNTYRANNYQIVKLSE